MNHTCSDEAGDPLLAAVLSALTDLPGYRALTYAQYWQAGEAPLDPDYQDNCRYLVLPAQQLARFIVVARPDSVRLCDFADFRQLILPYADPQLLERVRDWIGAGCKDSR